MQLVRAAFGDHLDLRTAVAAVDGGEVVGHDAHFLDRFGVRRQVGDPAARNAIRARVVDGERVGLVALTAGVDARRRFAGEGIVPGAAGAERRRDALARDAGLQRDRDCRDSVRSSGISCSWMRSTRPDTRPCSVSTSGAVPATVTVSLTFESSSVKSSRARLADADM